MAGELAAAVGDWFLHTHIREGMGPQRMDLRFRLGVADEKLLAVLRSMESRSRRRSLARHWHARPASRCASSSGCSSAISAAASIGITACLRLERARQLLRETTLPVLDVALATGFASVEPVRPRLQQRLWRAPSETRQRVRLAR